MASSLWTLLRGKLEPLEQVPAYLGRPVCRLLKLELEALNFKARFAERAGVFLSESMREREGEGQRIGVEARRPSRDSR